MDQEIIKNVIATTASLCTIVQFLSGSLVCVKIVQNKSTGDISPFPFVSGWLSTCLWLRYGIYIQESSITLVNTIGAILFFAYVCTFLFYTLKKSIVIRQFLTCSIFLTIILIYVGNEDSFEDGKRSLGIICSFVTIVFFAAPLASFFHVITVKSSESLSFPMIFANFIVSSQWLMYGILLNDAFLKGTNFLGCMLSGFQLCLFCIYPKNPKMHVNELIL